jgi:hypothetical protein
MLTCPKGDLWRRDFLPFNQAMRSTLAPANFSFLQFQEGRTGLFQTVFLKLRLNGYLGGQR